MSEKPIQDIYPLSPMQEGMLFHSLFEEGSEAYFEQVSTTLHGELDTAVFRSAWQQVVERHTVLRTGFFWQKRDQPFQVVYARAELPCEEQDWCGLTEPEQKERLAAFLAADRARGFDLARPPLMRIAIFRLGERAYQFVWSHHHILLDGWARPQVLQEVLALYDAMRRGEVLPLPSPRPYRDYIAWLQQQDRARAEAFWRRTLGDFAGPTLFGVDRPVGADGNGDGHRRSLHEQRATALPARLLAELQSLGREHRVTLAALVQSVWGLLLSRYSGEEDVVFGTVVSGRPPDLPGVETMVGLFINTLPVRVRSPRDLTCLGWLQRQMALQAELRHYEYSPLVEVRKWSLTPAGRQLFESIVVFQNLRAAAGPAPIETELRVAAMQVAESADFPLVLIAEPEGELVLRIEYDHRRFDAVVVERMLGHLGTLLRDLPRSLDRCLGDLALLTGPERHQLLREWNATERPYPGDRPVHELLAERMAATPEATAVVFRGGRLSFRELGRQANRLAHCLRELGIGPDVPVGLCVERSADVAVGVLGILGAGGACVPLDPAYPAERLAYMLADARVPVLVTQERIAARLQLPGIATVRLDADAERLARAGDAEPGVRVEPDNLAYVIYTSGSTGRPKGVRVPHRPLVHYAVEMARQLGLRPTDRVLQFASLSFDVVIEELFPTWLSGGAVVFHDEDLLGAAADLGGLLERQGITALELPAAFWHEWVRGLVEEKTALPPSLRLLLVGSEKPMPERLAAWRELAVPLVYVFGLTETTVTSTLHWLPAEGDGSGSDLDLPIGRPLANTAIHLLDAALQPVPAGVVGEMYIGGAGVAQGYFGRPDLTAERFVPDPFGEEPGQRLYRTGDLARHRLDGVIDFLGRADDQVKIRGFRVEPGEVEAELVRHAGVREAVVVARPAAAGGRRLVAYVVPEEGQALPVEELRAFLRRGLPDHMIPAAFVKLAALPLTPNGKVDRRALPAPEGERPDLERELVAPRTEVERQLAAIWSQALGVQELGVHDDFFALGGDSILSIQIVAKAQKLGLRLTPRQLFEHPTIAELATLVATAPAVHADQGPMTGPVPLTPIQHWFFEQGFAEPHHFNLPLLLELRGFERPGLVEGVLPKLLEHHDALRLRFRRTDAGWEQAAEPFAGAPVTGRVELEGLPEEARGRALEEAGSQLQRSLGLAVGPLFRAARFGLGPDRRDHLLLVAHHLVMDTVSLQVLAEDLAALCRQAEGGETLELPPRTTSYKVWAERLAGRAASPEVTREADYWAAPERAGVPPLPVDLPGDDTEASASTVSRSLEADETRALLQELPKAYRTQILDALLAALAMAFSPWTGDRRLLVDLEGHGREEIGDDVDLSRTVGWFANLYPVLLDLRDASGPGDALKAVKEQLRAVPHRGLHYGLLRYLAEPALGERLRAMPRAEVLFNYVGQLDQQQDGEGLPFALAGAAIGPSQSPRAARTHRLEVNAAVSGGRLTVSWTYGEGVLRRETVERLAEGYLAALRGLVEHGRSAEAGGYTPSDFPLARLAQRRLDALVAGCGGRVEDVYPLSPMQEGMLFHALFEPEAGMYIGQMSYRLEGELDTAAFEQAWQQVVARHPSLRTVFVWQDLDRPLQVVLPRLEPAWERQDWRALAPDGQRARLAAFAEDDKRRGFDPGTAPLMRFALLRLEERAHQFVWTHHQMLLDGWSLPLVLGDVFLAYEALRRGEAPRFEPAPSYRDYIAWLERQDRAAAEAFWRRALGDIDAPTALAVERAHGAPGGHRELQVLLPGRATAALQTLARRHQLTLNTLVQGAWALLLQRYSGAPAVVFGAVVAGRPAELDGVERIVGLFINTLPVRADHAPRERLIPWLKGLQERQLEMSRYEHSALSQVQRWSGVPAGQPLFETILAFQNQPSDEGMAEQAPGLRASRGQTAERTNYPMTVVAEPGPRLSLILEYDRERFDDAAVLRLAGHLESILQAMTAAPHQLVEELPLLRAPERQQVLVEWQGPHRPEETARTLYGEIAGTVRRQPDATAVVLGEHSLSYGGLQTRAHRLARHLRALGVGPETVVGLLMDRSLELVEGLLGVLAAGGAYLPLDPAYPAERLLYMLADSGARVVLTTEALAPLLAGWRGAVVRLDAAEAEAAGRRSASPLRDEELPESLAYVIYTSGSTGRPKGVAVANEAVVRYGREMVRQLGLTPSDRMLQFASPSFDVLVEELVPTWLAGGAVVLHGRDLLLSVGDLEEVLERQAVTCMELPAAYWQEWVYELEQSGRRAPAALRFLIIGSEKPSPERLRAWMGLGVPSIYIFGLTETTVTSCLTRLEPGELERADGFDLPIGRPVGEARLLVLDREGGPLPIGVAGELLIGGPGVGRGYVGRPELTAERFVPDHLGGHLGGEPGARLYRTGDLARRRAAGELDFLGRIDEQVKVRGFRVELGEIESALRDHPGVRDAAVVLQARRLVGYVVAADAAAPGGESLRSHLLARLPEHMVPPVWVVLESLPLTPNGKLDRRALPEPERAGERAGSVAPRTEIEERLARIWSEVLGVEKVGVEDDFFELGGDSILSLQIVARAHRAGIQLTPKQLFEHPTIGALAAVAGSGPGLARAEQGQVTGPVPLTPIQRWFFDQDLAAPHHFNQSALLELRRPLEPHLLERVARRILEHHDALRLRFAIESGGTGGWRQVCEPPDGAVPLAVLDLTALPREVWREAIESAAQTLQGSLDLSAGPLLRLALFTLGAGEPGRLLAVFHHLIVDEVSWRVLLEDLEQGYGLAQAGAAGQPIAFPPKTTSFKTWAERLLEHARSGALETEVPYWLAEGRRRVRPLPVDFPRTESLVGRTRTVTAALEVEETSRLLRDVPPVYRTQIQEVLLAALGLTLARWTGERLALVDLEGHGREEIFPGVDLTRTVGWFATLYPMLLDLRDSGAPGDVIRAAKQQVRALPNRGIGYGLLRHLAGGETARELASLPGAELLFNYVGQLDQVAPEASGFGPARESSGLTVSPLARRSHLLEVTAMVVGGRLQVEWTYDPQVHRPETVESVAGWFGESLRSLIAHCLSPEAGGYTPSDFPLAHLSQADLDRVVGRDREVEDVYALSPVQEGMLFHTLYEPDAGMYVGQFSYELRGELDTAALRSAWQRVIERHAALRTGVAWQGLDRPLQVVRRRAELPWEELDWRGLDEPERRLAEFLRADRERAFDMTRPPLLRMTLIRREEEAWQLVWSFHQMLLDGWSLPLVFADVAHFLAGREGLPPARPYRDYIAWLERRDPAEAEGFWRQALAGLREPTPLGAERAFGGAGLEETYGELETVLSAETTQSLQALARGRQLTLNTLFQGAWGLLLSRYSGEPDVVFGVTVSGRPPDLDGVEEIVGMFLNTLPVRVRVRGHEPWTAWLRGLQEEQLELRRYEHTPLAQIQKWSDIPAGRPLFESFLVFQNYPVEEAAAEQAAGDLGVGDVAVAERGNYPLIFVVEPLRRLEMRIEFDRRRFEPNAIQRLLGHLEAVLAGLLAAPAGRVEELPLLREPERQQVLVEWQGPHRKDEGGWTVHGAFAEMARHRPDAPAAVLGEHGLSYGELQARSHRLARHLRALGAGPEVVVGLLVDRSLALVEGLLGVLAAGGAYLPLDPAYPTGRLLAMLADSGARVVVTTEALAPVLSGWDGVVVRLDGAEAEAIARRSASPLRDAELPESLAYVIYTSGSTGKPKGVAVAHEAVVRYGREMVRQLGLAPADRMLQFASPSFDVLVEELVPTWLAGGAVVLHGRDLLLSMGELEAVLERQAVTCLELPAAYWQEWVYELEQAERKPPPALRFLIVGAEKPSPERVRAWMGLGVPMIYIFGLTETTVTSSLHRLEPGPMERADGFDLPIGRPVGEARLYLLDRDGGPLPIGVAGELSIGGPGVGRGYVGQPELTAQRFVPDHLGGEPGARLYRTGDLARWRAAGELDFLGRIDAQVKVRGFRVELGEIESALRDHPGVRDAAVALRARRLVGYVVASAAAAPEPESLRSHLLARLPEHMVPAAWVVLEALPLTANGKLDRRALPEPERTAERAGFVAPRTELEERLAAIWSEVLGVQRVGVEDDFFELGGDSILSLQIVARAHRAGIQLTPKQLFEHPTIAALASLAAVAGSGSGLLHAEQGWVTGPVPLTPIQHWFFAQGFDAPHHFNQPLLLEVRQPLDAALAERVLRRVMEHHDALRLRFVREGSGWHQVMEAPPQRAPVVSLDLSALPAERQGAAVEEAAAAVQASLDLAGPLVRLALFDLGAERPGRLLLVFHHLVVDEVSMQVVLEDLETALGQASRGEPVRLPAKTSSYKAWAERLVAHAGSGALDSELSCWLAPEREQVEPLPVDQPGGVNVESSARHAWSELTAEETAALLREVPKAYRTPVQEVLLTALALTMARWTRRPLVLVDLEGQGREPLFAELDVSRTVGWFTAIHPVLLDLRGPLEPGAALKAVKEQLRSVPGGGVGYGLLRHLGGEAGERLARLPAAELLFNYQGHAEGGGEATGAAFAPAPESPGPDIAPGEKRTHLLEVDGAVEQGRLRFAWTYSANLHREETARALAGWFEEALRSLIAHCLSPDAGGYTPSDFPLAHLGQADLDRVVGRDREVEDVYVLSPVQEGMLFHTLYEPDAGMYVGQFSYGLQGELDTAALRGAWQRVVDRHPALRTAVAWQGLDRPVQVVRRRVELPWEELDWRDLDEDGQRRRLAELLRADRERGFETTRPPLMRMTLIRRAEQAWQLVWSFHQMLLDGWSLPLVFEEVARFFGGGPELPPARPYRDYIAWLERRGLAEAEAFWRRTLAGLREPTPLGAERASGGEGLEETYGELQTALSLEMTQSLQALARGRQLTLNTLFQGAWGLLLSRYGGGPDVVFGVTVSGRPPDLDGVEEIVGMFLNTLPVRVRVRGGEPWAAWLRGLQTDQLELREHEHTPLAQIQKWSDIPAGRPLFESYLVFQNYPVEEAAATQATEGLSVGDAAVAERGNYPLTFVVEPVERLEMRIELDLRRFEPGAVQRMLGHLEAVLEGLLAAPEGRVGDLPLLREPERQQLLVEWQGPHREPADGWTVHRVFAGMARLRPDAPAAVLGEHSVSYGELQARANRLARHLRALGVGPEVVVGLLVQRSLPLVEGILGVLAAGGAYLPLDLAYPADRLLYMLADSGARVVVTAGPPVPMLDGWTGTVVRLDGEEAEAISRRSATPLAGEELPQSLAYVIYTSGSTGRPKGVGVSHEAVVRYGREMVRQLGMTPADRMLQFASPSFDVLVEELIPTWFAGGAVVLPGRDLLLSMGELEEVLERQAVTCLELPAAYWQEWVYELEQAERRPPASLRFLIMGGEKPGAARVRAWMGLGVPLVYIFGLTETTVTSSLTRLEPGEAERADGFDLPIGRPVGEARLYVLDREGGALPIGVAGELSIGGPGVGRGYVGRPDLTAQRFVPGALGGEPGARLYRTGDLTRWRATGELDFLGRIDAQVKVRGFRVELGEIESALRGHPGVRDAAVDLRARRLVGYVVASGTEAPAAESLRSHLLSRLPEHMAPAAWVVLEALPLTANGKLDRRALPEPERMGERTGFVAPRTELEERLAGIWSEVLGVQRVGVEDDFFELGGDSILSLQIVARAHRAGIQLTPKQLFEHPTIAALAAVAGSGSGLLHAEQGWVTGPVPLTPIQHWFFAQGFGAPHHFNQPLLLEVRRPLDAALAERVLRRVMEHHDALRLRFVREGSGWHQVMEAPPQRAPVASLDLSALPAERQGAAVEEAAAAVQASLDLAGPLARLALFDLGAERPGRLLLVFHHLVVDEVSMQVVLEDLETALGQASRGEPVRLPAKTSSYKAWAERLVAHAGSGALEPELSCWLAPEREQVEPLPVDQAGGANVESSARHAWSELTAEETAALLREVPKAYRTPVQEVLLTALALTMARWTGQALVLVDLEGQGREPLFADLDVSRTVGWFTAIHPVLLDLRGSLEPGAALKAVKEQVRSVPGGGLGYGLLRYLGGEAGERLARLPAAELLFNYQGEEGGGEGAGASAFAPASESPGPDIAPAEKRTHLLEVDGAVEDGRLRFAWTYSANLHREETARTLAGWFEEALRSLIAHCLSPEAGGYTPSDFPLAHLTQADLDRVVGRDREVEDVYALSPVQEGMLFHTLYEPDAGMYVGQFSYELRGGLDTAALRGAWQRVVDRHVALRTGIAWQGLDRPVQVVRRRVELPWQELDWRDLDEAGQRQRLADLLRADRERGFEVSSPPLMRVAVLHLAGERHLFLWSFHQMAMDGWSLPLLINEATTLYQALSTGRDLDLPRPRPFRDYIAWLRKQDTSRAEPYWREALKGFGAPTPLPFDRPAGVDGEEGHGEAEARLPAAVLRELDALARQNRLTLNTLVQGVWALLLSRYSGEEDVLFGATVSGRPPELEEVEEMVGLFINSLPVRVLVSPEARLMDWLRQLQERQVELRQFEYSPLFEVQRWSDVPAGQPLFDSILVFENYPQLDGAVSGTGEAADAGEPGLQIGDSRVAEQANYPLALGVETDRELLLRINYDASRFDHPTIVRLLAHLENVLRRLPDRRHGALSELHLLGEGERHQLLVEWSDTAVELERRPVHELFRAQAARTPEAPALEHEGEIWTYAELNRRANRLAHHLRGLGVRPGGLVGLCLERSPDLVASILAIFKAGAVYVPLDPAYPRERLAFMLEDCGASVLLTTGGLPDALPAHDALTVDLDARRDDIARAGDGDPEPLAGLSDLAYLIYTSGTTGRPKAVMVEHGNLAGTLLTSQRRFGFQAGDVMLHLAPFSFDISLFELFNPLLAGGSSLLVPRQRLLDLPALAQDLARATLVHTVPSLMRQLVGHLREGGAGAPVLRGIFIGGDYVLPGLLDEMRQVFPAARVHVLYGPTETTIICSAYPVPPEGRAERSLIGRPLDNVALRLLDRAGQPVPVGVAGELYVGGAGVTRGYLHRDDLTRAKFVELDGRRFYRTGDLARFRSDGDLEFLGRADDQVKVRGFRVELGEIEAVLAGHPGVREAVVVARGDREGRGEKRLVAYIVLAGEQALTTTELRRFCQEQLPDYMVPGSFVPLDALPLTPAGKVDRRALPEPEGLRPELEAAYVSPETALQNALAGIWAEVLGVERVGVHDDFFELGGDSILSLQICARAHRAGLQITPKQIFQNPTVERLALVAGTAGLIQAEQGPVTGPVPLTPIQARFLERGPVDPHHFNLPVLLEVRRRLAPEIAERVLQEVLAHHDALRMRFARDESGWRQTAEPPGGQAPMVCIDLAALPDGRTGAAIEAAAGGVQTSLDLVRGPLVRLALFDLGTGRPGRLLLVFHHLVADEISLQILLEDLEEAFEQASRGAAVKLPPKTTSFKAWAERLVEHARSEALAPDAGYWLAPERDQVLPLPVDLPDGADTDAAAQTVWAVLPAGETQDLLHEVPKSRRTQVREVLLAAAALALARWSGQRLLLVDVEGHGREELFLDVNVARTVGWFTTIHPVLLDLRGAEAAGAALNAVREQLRAVPGHGIGYGLLRYLGDEETAARLRRQPAAEVVFNYRGQVDGGGTREQPEQPEQAPAVFVQAAEPAGPDVSPRALRDHRFEIEGAIEDGELRVSWTCGGHVYRRETAAALAGGFLAALRELIAHCLSPEPEIYAPADFPLAQLDDKNLGRLASLLDEIDRFSE